MDPCLGYLCIAQIRNRAGVVGHPVQQPIMEGQQHAITGSVHVSF